MSAEKEPDHAAIGARLREAREYLGFTQAQVAKALGLLRPSVTMIEIGARKLSAAEVGKLSRLFRVPASHLLGGPPERPAVSVALQLALAGLPEEDRAEVLRFAEFLHFRQAQRRQGGAG